MRAPLFPLGLKLTFAMFGRSPLAAKGVSVAMAVIGCLLVASCVRSVAGVWASAISLVLLALYPTLITFEHAILTEAGTFFFVALALRLSLWTPETTRAAWTKAVSLGLVLGAGYYWRQTLLALVPWFALLHLLAARGQPRDRRGSLQLVLQALVVLLLPWFLKVPWSLRFETGTRNAHVVQAFAVKQALLPIADPRVAHVSGEYHQAIATMERDGPLSGMPWNEASRIADKLARPSSAGALAYLTPLVAQYPARYAFGVGRTLLFFAGFEGTDDSIQSYRALVLSPKSSGAKIGAGPEPVANRFRKEFFHPTRPGFLQRMLWSICGIFDFGLILCSAAAVALFMTSLPSKNPALLAVTGTPVVFALAHALLLFSINRFMVPIYPITLACGIILAALVGSRLFGKEAATMTAPTRVFSARTATLAWAGVTALLFSVHACGRPQSSEKEAQEPAPAVAATTGTTGATGPAGSAPNLETNETNILPDLICGRLDGATPVDGGGVFVWGWAYDPRSGSPATDVVLLDNGQRVASPVQLLQERPDVAAAKGNQRLRTSGWNVLLPAGLHREHAFTAYAILADGKLGRVGGTVSVSEP